MAQGEERSAPAQDLDASSSTCAVEENGEASAEKGTGQGEGGPSYGFLTSLPSSEAESIQAQIMRQLEVIMVGQRGGGGPGEAGEEETSIQEDLSVLNEYVWHLLTQEVANQERLKKELLEFLQTNTEPFVTWLHEVLSRRDPSGAMLMAPVGGGAKGGDMVDDGAVTPRSRPLEGEEEETGVREKSYERDGRRRSRESSSRHESSRHRD
ncbi:zinc finger (ccch type), partial [Cystoisospora suis]